MSFLYALLAIVTAVNLQAIGDYFHGDDYIAFIDLTNKPPLQHMWEVIRFKDADIYWRPLGELYYLIIYKIFGLSLAAYHLGNVVLFIACLVGLYHVTLRAGFSRIIATLAVGIFGLYPNHVVSVSWVTNGPRILAVMFALFGLVAVQASAGHTRFRYEALAFLCFTLAALSDEVAVSLAPLAVLYGVLVEQGEKGWLRRAIFRSIFYGALVGTIVPAQFLFGTSGPGFEAIGFGPHMASDLWALGAKLVMPLKDGVQFGSIPIAAWSAGAVAGFIAIICLVFGSPRLRFLVLWTLLALSPFTIWRTPIAPARYVFMAAVPFAIIAAWLLVSIGGWVLHSRPGVRWLEPRRSLSLAAVGLVLAAFGLLGGIFTSMTIDRNNTFARESEPYRVLAEDMPKAVPVLPKGSRVVIYYGVWTGLPIWPEAVLRTVYHDPTLSVVNVPRGQVEAGTPLRGSKDTVVYYTGSGFIVSAPLREARVQ